MSKIVTLPVPNRIESLEARLSALLDIFATHRRFGDDVYWLKENAEVLNILETTGQQVDHLLAPHADFYAGLEDRFAFFPQYYRFFLSIALDLEDLGMPGDVSERLIDRAISDDLVRAELSDLQRAEASRLMARRGRDPLPQDPGLTDRLHGFIGNSRAFALPNKKAAYELTHIVFYLSEYGRRDPGLSEEAMTSLEHAGMLAFLDQNVDLMAEICISMVWAGRTPPAAWTDWVLAEMRAFELTEGDAISIQDDYHTYLMCNWFAAIKGLEPFRKSLNNSRVRFDRVQSGVAPLRQMSECMYQMGQGRSANWSAMRRSVEQWLSPEALNLLHLAETSCDGFDRFFEGFSRAARTGSV
ncbi:DUF6902 family protein [Pseudoprimorskyibacter insulae]|uniref:Uncharacterized protein n=1 Tax=Pseudoprimorskyibacter insulae TaxID=1695997 RepID=A0A2R8AWB2_9RHOB|nr:hypothetical protein [Pseudoprimorskyibacter insulae]SPF80310.1 hypothetical protein PRI8871_02113 [Pseudoprimorskyibacter insulae]